MVCACPARIGNAGGIDGSRDEAVKCVFDRRFLARFSRVSPPFAGENTDWRGVLNHARVASQNLREVLRKRRARHNDVRAGFLRLLL